MTYLIIFVTVLSVLNLLLLLALVVRLRGGGDAHGAGPAPGRIPLPVLPPGAVPSSFAATTQEGEVVDAAGVRLVGFFSPACSLCGERLPDLLDYVRRGRFRRDEVLAVLIGAPGEVEELAARLRPAARVVVEEEAEGPVWRAFGLRGLPAFYLLDDRGVITGSGTEPAALPTAEPV
ncbi:hypothetical protein [Nonomuraea sp. NPDC005692]|uniref:hypothetical protein n=1 Tax=Nonomuraea sp. NPDC005692 TaxID=3157168 RepID=UPI00340B3F90